MGSADQERRAAIEEVIKQWRETLINLTGRNRLLNFTVTKSTTLPLTVPDYRAVLDRLNGGRPLTFVPLKPPPATGTSADADLVLLDEPARVPDWVDPTPRAMTDRAVLGANVDPSVLTTALRNLMSKSNQTFLDTGLWTLYLAFGTLSWAEPEDPKSRYRSPLVLVPVSLQSPGPRMPPQLSLGMEDVVINPALILKMQSLGLEIPDLDLEDDGALEGFLNALDARIARRPGWAVGRDVFLSYFTFHKEAMYRDLLDNLDLVMESDQVQALASSGMNDQTDAFLFDPVGDDQIDAVDPPEEALQVLDADASQRAAIAAAAEGKSFVIDGPPGTGKSQTITNIIASLIPQGKSVLFVSEKAAALEVVKNRLDDVGLASYVLELHSHKATRKEVAEELSRAVLSRPKGPAPLDKTSVSRLRKARHDLSAYAAAMNRTREPLGMTVHDGMGWVSGFEDLAPTRPCNGDLLAMTAGDLADIQTAASDLSRAWRPAIQGEHFLWKEVARRDPITFELNQALQEFEQLQMIVQTNDAVMAAFGWDRPSDAEDLEAVLQMWASRPNGTPLAWLQTSTFGDVEQAVVACSDLLSRLRTAEAAATEHCGAHWPRLNEGPEPEAFANLREASSHLRLASPVLDGLTSDQLAQAHLHLDEVAAAGSALHVNAEQLAPRLGLLPPKNLQDVAALIEVEHLSRSVNRPEGEWLKTEVDGDVQDGMALLKQANLDCARTQDAALKHFAERILDLDPESLYTRFSNVHRGLHKLSGDYRSDLRALGEASTPGMKAKHNISNLPIAIEWQQALALRQELEGRYMALLGPRYKQIRTDWSALEEALATARRIAAAAKNSVLENLMQAVGHDSNLDPGNPGIATELQRHLDYLSGTAKDPNDRWMSEEFTAVSLAEQASWCDDVRALLGSTESLTRNVSSTLGTDLTLSSAETATVLARDARLLQDRLQAQEATWGFILDSAFHGRDTDLEHLAACAAWAQRLQMFVDDKDRSAVAAVGGMSPDQTKALETSVPSPSLAPSAERHEAAVLAVCEAFDVDRGREIWTLLNSWAEGPELLREMLADSAGQDEWFSYQEADKALQRWGLAGVVDSASTARCPAHDVPSIITREVMRRWVDQILESEKILQNARSLDKDALAVQFRDLDQQLVASTVSRVIDRANAFRPTSTVGQAGEIISEGKKKRRHMPIRELIARTKDVTLGVKPVFMMSPLSVSQYLPPDLRFDVVIFDEASQVMPEDAINCIYRGNSLIIAGDEKQLPPTNFFAPAAGDADATWEDDQSSAKDFESVLSIAKGCGAFISLTLNWHYRSRHEALIAFSNNRFYGGELITFPSAQAEGNDVGVEFYLIEDGIYDRGGSARNMNEARAVARRIEYHYDTRPHLSLGVVAFSQPQAEAIQFAVDELVIDRPDLEAKFQGSRLDALFIKNLESVQGDERDVMIFSVGYGPDKDRKLTMNFGPINRDGGWRRLNVAVTRARYRNEVVASFPASLMTAGGSRSVGEFRRYLDYAANGMSALSLEDAIGQGDAESPFEESVLTWLRSEGHNVTSQVGSSGYRIDMAVRHPDFPSRFILGIECDGAAYHSSQTARDRDRLREQVLTGLGWKLHRIWGTAWYRHRDSEKQRLREAIDKAISAPTSGLLPRHTSGRPSAAALIDYEDVDLESIADWAVPYVRSSPPAPPRHVSPSDPESVSHHATIIKAVVAAEGPIHLELIDQRIREAWDIGRIGPNIRGQVTKAIIRTGLQQDGDFLIPDGMDGSFPSRIHDSTTKRDIAHIYMGELEETAYRVVRDAVAISLDDLVVSTARHLGFARVGDDVRRAITQALRNLQESGWVSGDDDSRIRILLLTDE